jgi:hypothetical protein
MIFQYQQRAEPIEVAVAMDLAFLPAYPDRVPIRGPRFPSAISAPIPDAFIDLRFRPSYPDRLPSRSRSSPSPEVVWPLEVPGGVELLATLTFAPVFPDRVPKLGRWAFARYEEFPLLPAFDLLADLTFAPSFPDRIPHPRWPRSQYEIWPTFANTIYPVPDLLASLTFAPNFPDRVPALGRWPRSDYPAMSAASLEPAETPTAWIPIYPDRLYARRLPIAQRPSFTTPTYGEALAVAARMAWNPTYPIVRPRRHYPLGVLVTVPAQTATIPCVEIIPIDLTATGLLNETLTTPTLEATVLTTPTFTEEDLC